ncbi:putative ATP-grasp-modified RiPP [Streptomyces sp. WA1-19]|uniref:putative ATP-grasp-modified RiPP n=1 Tax=unclassified Streptomyces TaxID=2593676 RepID=UPI001D04D3D8|nr:MULTISPECIES: putative ATP-grasp-modified RiPP [unclassified Streptomyces]UDF10953.1 putative ATP-grasp-modified RiPP [Streptomyces sp. WA1-19]UYX95474.1 putative ATP-grasp-modified RiPP [Streptomyces sp. BI87]
MSRTTAPRGTSRMRPYVAAVPVPQTMPTIDPEAQIALVVGGDGRTVGLGGHGPRTSGLMPTTTMPGDGAGPDGSTGADRVESYEASQ